jgi:Ribose/xylose/arabinose/galactoside ABC-type transport systems, permease components
MLILLVVIIAATNPSTVSVSYLANKSDAAFSLILAAVGQTFVLLTGGFDLSVGGVICITNSLLAVNMGDSPESILVFTFLSIAIGLGVGIFNGYIVEKTKIQPFIVTLATQSICSGIALLILKVDGGIVADGFVNFFMFRIGGIPFSLIMIAVMILLWVYVKGTRFGMALYAVGSNEKAAHLNGISVMQTKILAYGLSGLFAALAGIYRTAQVASGSPTAGLSFVMPSIAAAVIGGTSISGGVGGIVGSIVGVFIIRNITDLLVFMKVSSYWTSLVQGVLLLVAVAITSYAKLHAKGEKE